MITGLRGNAKQPLSINKNACLQSHQPVIIMTSQSSSYLYKNISAKSENPNSVRVVTSRPLSCVFPKQGREFSACRSGGEMLTARCMWCIQQQQRHSVLLKPSPLANSVFFLLLIIIKCYTGQKPHFICKYSFFSFFKGVQPAPGWILGSSGWECREQTRKQTNWRTPVAALALTLMAFYGSF